LSVLPCSQCPHPNPGCTTTCMDGSRCSTMLLPSDLDSTSQQQPTPASNSGGSSSSNLAPTTNCHQPLYKPFAKANHPQQEQQNCQQYPTAITAAGAATAAAAAAILRQRPTAISLSLNVLKTASHPQREFLRQGFTSTKSFLVTKHDKPTQAGRSQADEFFEMPSNDMRHPHRSACLSSLYTDQAQLCQSRQGCMCLACHCRHHTMEQWQHELGICAVGRSADMLHVAHGLR